MSAKCTLSEDLVTYFPRSVSYPPEVPLIACNSEFDVIFTTSNPSLNL